MIDIDTLNSKNEKLINQLNEEINSGKLNDEEIEIINKAIKKLVKAIKANKKAVKLISKTSVNTKTIVKNIKKTPEIKFTEIGNVDIGSTVGGLPVEAILKKSTRFDCKLIVDTGRHFILKKDSIICIGYLPKDSNKPWVKLRRELLDNGLLTMTKPEGYRNNKLVLGKDLRFESELELRRFILGRELNASDKDVSIMIGGLTLNRYIKLGNN